MGRSLALNEAGQHVSLWHARIRAAKEKFRKREEEREKLRRIVSELEFPPLMGSPEGIVDLGDDELSYAHIDQVDLNLFLRYVNKLKAHAGDEQPKITVPRGLSREKVARIEDAVLQRAMAKSGANEALLDAVGYFCTDGSCATWVVMPFLPSFEELAAGSKNIDQIIQEAKQGVAEPMPGQDHLAISAALFEASMKDPQAAALDRAMQDPMLPPETQLLRDAAIAYARAADEDEENGGYWRHERGAIVVEVQPLGEFGTLLDTTTGDLRTARWAARRVTLTKDEAHNHKSFHPKARTKLRPEAIMSAKAAEEGSSVEVEHENPEVKESENGLVVVWEIWDKEHNARYYVNEDVNLFLQKDEGYPYLNDKGESVIEPVGTHPGWFPCVIEPLMKPVRKGPAQIEGIPLLKPGLPSQLEIIKLVSALAGAVKRASAAVYLSRLDKELLRELQLATDGSIIEVGEEIEDLKNAIMAVDWKAPSPELFALIDKEIARFAIAMNFPMAEITSQPNADTATQEEIGMAAGSLGVTEILRRLEVMYGYWVWIAQAFIANYYTDGDVAKLGGPEALAIRQAWATQGRLPELPAVKLAARAKEANPVRVRQLMELYQMASVVIDPMTGFPKYDVDHLLLEAAETLGIGTLPPFEVTPEMIAARQAEMEQADGESGDSGEGGGSPPKAPSGERSEGQDTKTRKKPHPEGANENSAARRTDS